MPEDLPAGDDVSDGWTEPHLRPELAEEERLVRDGAAKVMAFSLVWTLAQYHQCKRPLPEGLRRIAEGAFQRISARCKAKSLKGTTGVKSNPDNPDAVGICAIIDQAALNGHLSDAAVTFPQILDSLVGSFRATARKDGELPLLLFEKLLIAQTWSRVNGMAWSASPSPKRVAPERPGFGRLRAFGKLGAVVRIFYGAPNSFERTTIARYEAGHELDQFLEGEPDGAHPATPVPFGLLQRWSRILGFPLEEDAGHSSASVWRDLCGAVDRSLCGSDLATFAVSLESFLKSQPTAVDAGFEKVVVSKKAIHGQTSGRSTEGTPREATGIQSQSTARTVTLIGIGTTPADYIEMRISDTSERITLEAIRYALDDPDEEDVPRVCLSSIDIVWSWERRDLVRFTHVTGDRNHGLNLLKRDNRDLSIKEFSLQDTSLRITIQAEPGAALAPKHRQAIDRLVMPEAGIKPEVPDYRHVFTIEARRRSLCLAKFDPSIGRMRIVATHEGKPLTQDESLRLIIPVYFTELTNEFPGFPNMKVLGKREYVVDTPAGSS